MDNQSAKLSRESSEATKRAEDRTKIIRQRWLHSGIAVLLVYIVRDTRYDKQQFVDVIFGTIPVIFLIAISYLAVKGWWSYFIKSDRYDWMLLYLCGGAAVLAGVITKNLCATLSGFLMIAKALRMQPRWRGRRQR